jgi:hypothetical protein
MKLAIGLKVIIENIKGKIIDMEMIDDKPIYLVAPDNPKDDLCGCEKKECTKASWFGAEEITVLQ